MAVNDKNASGCFASAPCPGASIEGRPERVPAAGYGNGTSLNNAASNGNYWSSVPNEDNSNNARNLYFNSDNRNTDNWNNRNNGQSVRPVLVLSTAPVDGVSHQVSSVPKAALLEDLVRAWRDARRHKQGRTSLLRFEIDRERSLVRLRDDLISRRYEARPSICFMVHDPKMREVFAADFRDRVVHHLFYNYVHEAFERTFIADSYSCIVGRGTHYGVSRLRHHLLSCSQNWTQPCYVLKLDIRGYFMAINRARLLERCREILVKSRRREKMHEGDEWRRELVDWLLEKICLLDPVKDCRVIGDRREWDRLPPEKSLFRARPGCGLPIGNLSSQLFSNVWLGIFDDFMKREIKCRHYGRYVDDAYVVGQDKAALRALVPRVREFLREHLELELNDDKLRVVNARHGVEFLGAFVKPWRTYQGSKTLRRMRGRIQSLDWSEEPWRIQCRVNSMLGSLSHHASYNIRRSIVWHARLRDAGSVSEDCLRFSPDPLKLAEFRISRTIRGSR